MTFPSLTEPSATLHHAKQTSVPEQGLRGDPLGKRASVGQRLGQEHEQISWGLGVRGPGLGALDARLPTLWESYWGEVI